MVEERTARRDREPQHLAHVDGVVASRQGRGHATLEVGQGPRNQVDQVLTPLEVHSRELLGPAEGKPVRPVLLPLGEDADAEDARGLEPVVGLGTVVDAHEHEGRLQAHGAERADREAQGVAVPAQGGDHGDAGSELAEGATESGGVGLSQPSRTRYRPIWPA
jgi:hypothetical protein